MVYVPAVNCRNDSRCRGRAKPAGRRPATRGRNNHQLEKGPGVLEQLELDRRLRLALDTLAFSEPTPVQLEVIPPALQGRDLLVSAETGSGKTLAYLLPLVQRLLTRQPPAADGPGALILVPTRELARQVLKQCRALLAKTPLQVYAITGGADFRYQQSLFRKNPEIVVATPGRLLEHCQRNSVSLDSLQELVLDEADRMLDLGLRDDVLQIAAASPPDRQVVMVSATLEQRDLGSVSRALLKTPQTIAIGSSRAPHSSITHRVVLADSPQHKDELLLALLAQQGRRRSLVFANKRSTATRLESLARSGQLRCACLHGELSTEERRRVVDLFREGKIDVLCASDVAARGLDIPDIDLVINYDLPHSGDDYLHRTGRSGRAGAAGAALSLVTARDWNLMISIQRYLKLDFQRHALPGLKARFSGPKKLKSSGKAAGSKKKKGAKKPAGATAAGGKGRRGKPGKRAGDGGQATANDGFGPLMKKKPGS